MWRVQTHSGPPVFLVPVRKDLARMNDTLQPNQKFLNYSFSLPHAGREAIKLQLIKTVTGKYSEMVAFLIGERIVTKDPTQKSEHRL